MPIINNLSPGDINPSTGDSTSTPSPLPQQPIPDPTTYGNGVGLISSFDKTDLDIENPSRNGGIPYQQIKDPTVYPSTTQAFTPNPGYFATDGKGASKFQQKWSPTRTYLDYMKDYT